MLYKDTYQLKRLETKDLPAVKELFLKVFNKKVSLSYLKNKYGTSYLGLEYICSIAYHDTTPIAFYGAIPQKFSNNEKDIFVAHACDSYTLQAYQGQGLHYQLAKFAYEIMKQNAIKFVYAFHSENTYHSTKKLDWKEYVHMQRFHIKVRTLPIAKVVNKLHLNSLYAPFFRKTAKTASVEKIHTAHKDKFRQRFDANFITYKNSIKEHYFIESHGCILWVKVEAIMLVGLFYAPSAIALEKAINKLKTKAFFLGITELLFQVHPESEMALQLKSIVAPKESWLVGYFSFDPTIPLEDFIFTYADLDTY